MGEIVPVTHGSGPRTVQAFGAPLVQGGYT